MKRRSMGRMLAALAVSPVALATLPGCQDSGFGPQAATAEESREVALETLVKAAKREGELVWYSVPAENVAKLVSEAFQKAYGIKTTFVRLASADLAARVTQEAAAGKIGADLCLASVTPFFKDALSKGWSTPLMEAGIPEFPGDFPKAFLAPDYGTAVVQVQPSGIAFNTNQITDERGVTDKAAIDDWNDLLDPKYKGRILLVDPKTSAAYTQFWNMIIETQGKDYLTRLKAQNPKLANGVNPATQQLANGEAAIVMPGVQSTVVDLKSKGAPVAFVQPPASTGPELAPMLIAKAAHPNAAKLFIHYLMAYDGNAILNAHPGSGTPRNQQTLPSKYMFGAQLNKVPSAEIYQLLGVAPK